MQQATEPCLRCGGVGGVPLLNVGAAVLVQCPVCRGKGELPAPQAVLAPRMMELSYPDGEQVRIAITEE